MKSHAVHKGIAPQGECIMSVSSLVGLQRSIRLVGATSSDSAVATLEASSREALQQDGVLVRLGLNGGNMQVVRAFRRAGGTLQCLPQELPASRVAFRVLPSDVLYPVCEHGMSRSQLLYQLLSAMRKLQSTPDGLPHVMPPHGAVHGADPFKPWYGLTADSTHDFLPTFKSFDSFETLDETFVRALGAPRVARFGDWIGDNLELCPGETFDYHSIAQARERARRYFSEHYYSDAAAGASVGRQARRVYFTFATSTAVVLRRLVECNRQLRDVVVVAIPVGDSVSAVRGVRAGIRGPAL